MVHVTMYSQLGLCLVLEEGIMQHLIVNINFANSRSHALLHPLTQTHTSIRRQLPGSANASVLNILGQPERRLMQASLVLKELSFLVPVGRHRNRVWNLLHPDEEQWIMCGHIPWFNQVRP